MKFKLFSFLTILAIVILQLGCYYDNFAELHPVRSQSCDTTKVMSFATDIVPILNNSCGATNSCHNSGNTVDLSNWAGVNYVAVGTNAQLYGSIIWDGSVSSNMPKGSSTKISVCDITKIKKWIDAGALNN